MIMKQFLLKYKIYILFTIFGGVSGYLYWSYVGCSSGTCLITSVWYNNTIYGAVVGYLLGGMIQDNLNKRKKTEEQLN